MIRITVEDNEPPSKEYICIKETDNNNSVLSGYDVLTQQKWKILSQIQNYLSRLLITFGSLVFSDIRGALVKLYAPASQLFLLSSWNMEYFHGIFRGILNGI